MAAATAPTVWVLAITMHLGPSWTSINRYGPLTEQQCIDIQHHHDDEIFRWMWRSRVGADSYRLLTACVPKPWTDRMPPMEPPPIEWLVDNSDWNLE